MRVRFWGTRGSIATPGPQTVRFGGNTSCVEVRTSDGTHLVFDAGTGIRVLGDALQAQGPAPLRGHILIGHTHWDHIQGFPFFAPLFDGANEWDVYAPRGFGASLQETLAGQMQYAYFPVNLDAMGATLRYHDLVEGSFMIDQARVTTRYLNHTALTLGYRVETDGMVLVYATDHECHSRAAGRLGKPLGQVLGNMHPGDRRHSEFVAGADLLIHDCQYTAAEYATHMGWGHSPLEYVVDLAMASGVRRLALFHHDPSHDDATVDAMVAAARQRVRDAAGTLEVFAAAEGCTVELLARAAVPKTSTGDAKAEVDTGAASARPVLIACASAELADRLRSAVAAEGMVAREAGNMQCALDAAHAESLALAVIDQALGAGDGPALCHALHAIHDAAQLPVIMLSGAGEPPKDTEPPGTTEWLALPVSAQYLRTKLRAALLRTRARWERAPMPADEDKRLRALQALKLLDTPEEERFDRITRLAAQMFNVPIALISLVDAQRQWFKSRAGLEAQETPREQSFCAHAILLSQALVVPDALLDERFADNPLVTAAPRVRFYAGHRIRAPDGSPVGTLCLIDHRPRQLGDGELQALSDLAALAELELHGGR